MDEIARQRAANLWESFARKFTPAAKAARLDAHSRVDFDQIGGLADAKDEILTYACAATSPEVYARWGTQSPSGLLLIGPQGCGKTLLASALATRAGQPFLAVNVPRLVIQTLHWGGKIPELLSAWVDVLGELPPTTAFFDELDFAHDVELGAGRRDLPTGPIRDFLLDLIDQTIGSANALVLGSTVRPDTLSPVYFEPGRFERIVAVQPSVPGDVVEALRIHAAAAEKRAGRPLFSEVDWARVVESNRTASIGNWVRLLHAVLRRKARCDAADEQPGPVLTQDFLLEVERFKRATTSLPRASGQYL